MLGIDLENDDSDMKRLYLRLKENRAVSENI